MLFGFFFLDGARKIEVALTPSEDFFCIHTQKIYIRKFRYLFSKAYLRESIKHYVLIFKCLHDERKNHRLCNQLLKEKIKVCVFRYYLPFIIYLKGIFVMLYIANISKFSHLFHLVFRRCFFLNNFFC